MTASRNILLEDFCYVFTESSDTWTESRKTCADKGGDLVTMETEKEWQFINKEIQKRATTRRWYIGLTNMRQEWKWVNGRPLTISRWNDGEPSGDGNVAIMLNKRKAQGLFNDLSKYTTIASICEILKGNSIRDREDERLRQYGAYFQVIFRNGTQFFCNVGRCK